MTFANSYSTDVSDAPKALETELVCTTNSLVALRAAVDNGADWVHLDYFERESMNNFTVPCLDNPALGKGIRYAHDKHCKVVLALDVRTQDQNWNKWHEVICRAAALGIDAIELSDPSLLLFAAAQCPELGRHYLVPDTALNCETIALFQRRLGLSRIVLPPIVTFAQVERIAKNTPAHLQVTAFSRRSAIVEGSKTKMLSHDAEDLRAARNAGDTVTGCCAIPENAANDGCFALDKLAGIGALKLLPRLTAMGVHAIKVEAAGHEPSHLAQITRVWREAVDDCLENLERFSVKPSWIAELAKAARNRNVV